uniref:ATP synthase subunit a n=1 Tax=Agonoscena pistaciae TaxID=1635299 RepID=A0A8F2Q839_9HEMI|nr:ATP synthase F0 subunit 6 [Agonoscena pistaciae]
MMMSLFSMFDPTAMLMIQLNWINMILNLILLPPLFWTSMTRTQLIMNFTLKMLNSEFTSLFSKKILFKGSTLIMLALFSFIILNNLMSNFPYTFCCSAHIAFSSSLAIPIWLSIIIFCWVNLSKTMFSHLVPSGTPPILMPVMVMIELTSNLIRPMALAVRLSANLIAGHLLMALLGNTFLINSTYWPLICVSQTLFLLFELMVAMIQAYVFSVLMTLYSSEIS